MEQLEAYVEKLGFSLTAGQVEQFLTYQTLLLQWNERVNLTAAKSPLVIQKRHFIDSLTCIRATGDLNSQSLIDVGSGAGFPGLPLKIIFPGSRLTLLESVGKKARFLQSVVTELRLEDVAVIASRAETVAHEKEHRQQYDWATARAVAHLSPVLEYLLPFCNLGGHALALKGARTLKELSESLEAIEVLGGKLTEVLTVAATDEVEAYLVVVEKVKETPFMYPRRIGVPTKRPL